MKASLRDAILIESVASGRNFDWKCRLGMRFSMKASLRDANFVKHVASGYFFRWKYILGTQIWIKTLRRDAISGKNVASRCDFLRKCRFGTQFSLKTSPREHLLCWVHASLRDVGPMELYFYSRFSFNNNLDFHVHVSSSLTLGTRCSLCVL